MSKYYVSYKNYLVTFDKNTFSLVFTHTPTNSKSQLIIDGLWQSDKQIYKITDYTACEVKNELSRGEHRLLISFDSADENLPKCDLTISLNNHGARIFIDKIGNYTIRLVGSVEHGGQDCFAVNTKDTTTEVIRAGIGPTASKYDNALYNPQNDTAFVINGNNVEFFYNWTEEKYNCKVQLDSKGVDLFIKKHLLAKKYSIDFKPLKKRPHYDAPPSGWMTWYSVKFDASEEAVLRNTKFQQEVLSEFGANTIWVDWEWCHQAYEAERFDGVDNFNPDPKKYPNGLKYVADKIKEAGFIPALWIGFTNDIGLTEYEKEHPEISLSHHYTWSGTYYYDISHPEYLNGFLTKALRQVKDWGYKVVKYDTLPNCIDAVEVYHGNMFNPDLTTFQAYRGMIEKTRQELGEDFYMLSCGGSRDVVLWGVGVFDAARVGPDLFTWAGFVENINRVRNFYPLHNIAIINDADNVVLRDEYSTYEQAVSRISFVSLLGLPLTLGDDLPLLQSEKLDLIKRALPVIKTHPTDFNNAICDGKTQTICLDIATPFESYSIVGVINLTEDQKIRDLSLSETLRLHDGEYLLFEYFSSEFLGIVDSRIEVKVDAFDTKIICLRKKLTRPQLLSTSRHITQGAAEIKEMCWDDNTLSITSTLVKNDPYTLSLFVPDEYELVADDESFLLENNVLRYTYIPIETKEYTFNFTFKTKEKK